MITTAPAIDADLLRLRHEFLSMPGLVLTAPQTARLLDIRVWHAEALLATLEDDGFLVRTRSAFRRAEPPMA